LSRIISGYLEHLLGKQPTDWTCGRLSRIF